MRRLNIRQRRHEIGLGAPPVVTLAKAREAAMENARKVRDGGDPIEDRRRRRETLTFAQAVDRFLEAKLDEFTNAKHRAQWRSTLDGYAVPVIGTLPVVQIATADVLRVLQPLWQDRTETASRLRGRMEAVLSWATVAGHRTGDNPARWKGNLSELLPKPAKVTRGGHQPALALADAPQWFADVAARAGAAALALRFAALTGARSGEVRGALWSEIDRDAGIWTVPAARMKAGREHRVPLTKPALAILDAASALPAGRQAHVFPAPGGSELSDMALSAAMRRAHAAAATDGGVGYKDPRLGRPAVPHGLRSTFHDWAAERGYGRMAAAEVFLRQRGEAHPEGVANLAGARMVLASELPHGKVWDDQTLKDMTGGERLSARHLCGQRFEFTPRATVIVTGNHKPSFPSADKGLKRRLVLIKFRRVFAGSEIDPKLAQRLCEEEGPAILRWMIDGAVAWFAAGGGREGLAIPADVLAAGQDYFDEEDIVRQFLIDRQLANPAGWGVGAFLATDDLHREFQRWADDAGHKRWAKNLFARQIASGGDRYGLASHRTKAKRGFMVVRLLIGEDEREAAIASADKKVALLASFRAPNSGRKDG